MCIRSPAFRRFFARIPAKADTTNIGHFFPRAVYRGDCPLFETGKQVPDPLDCRVSAVTVQVN